MGSQTFCRSHNLEGERHQQKYQCSKFFSPIHKPAVEIHVHPHDYQTIELKQSIALIIRWIASSSLKKHMANIIFVLHQVGVVVVANYF